MSETRPLDLPVSMTPHVTWVHVDPADVLSAMKTLGRLEQEGRHISYKEPAQN